MPISVSVGAQHYDFPQEDFFGIGRDSLETNRTNYLLRSTDVATAVRWKPGRFVEAGAGASYMSPRIGKGTDDRFPSTGQAFEPDTIAGLTAQPDFLRADVSAAFDWRDNPLYPHLGGRYGVVVSRPGPTTRAGFDCEPGTPEHDWSPVRTASR